MAVIMAGDAGVSTSHAAIVTQPTLPVPQNPREFATALLALVAKGLESEATLDAMKGEVDTLVKSYTGRKPTVVLKAVASRQMIYGWANVVTKDGAAVTDRQGDVLDINEFRDAVHKFVSESRVGNVMHAGPQTGEIVDSFVWDNEVSAAFGVDFGCEGWMVGYKVTDPNVWKRVESGELKAFSIEGDGVRTPIAA